MLVCMRACIHGTCVRPASTLEDETAAVAARLSSPCLSCNEE